LPLGLPIKLPEVEEQIRNKSQHKKITVEDVAFKMG
jgi:hypothetical protein